VSSARRFVRPLLVVTVLVAACGLTGCTGSAGNGAVVTVLGSWTSKAEYGGFMAMVQAFEQKYDYRIHVIYTPSRDASDDLATEIKNGDYPDLAVLATPGVVQNYAEKGYLQPIDSALDLQAITRQYGPSWRQLMQATGPSGTKSYYAIIVKAQLKSLIWYDPAQLPLRYQTMLKSADLTWNQLISVSKDLEATGTSPWCVGVEDSSNSGWPGTDWIEDIVLHQSGVQVYDQWVAGTLLWTSAPITSAWQAFRQIAATPGLVHGGTPAELTTDFDTVGKSLFTSPPGCYLDHEASFITADYVSDGPGSSASGPQLKPGTDFNFIPFPSLDSADQNNLEFGADLLGMFRNTPAARAFLAYLTTPQAQEAWTSRRNGGAISVNKDVPASSYADPVSSDMAKILANASSVRFDASDSMPSTMSNAFDNAVLEYIDDPKQLGTILLGLDQVQKAAYAGHSVTTARTGP
jgi:alpha-glucoside transport system substrate-binding protein